MFDVLTVAAVADELAETILDGRIQRIGLVDRLTVAAEVYAGGRRHALVASAATQDGRIHLAERLPSLDPALITPFGLLLRKYLRGGVVIGVEQPPLERMIRLSIAKRLRPHNAKGVKGDSEAKGWVEEVEESDETAQDEVDDEGEVDATYVHLVVELMGRHSNLILVNDEGLILESAKHVTPRMSRVRPIWPRMVYTPPPPVAKPDPRRLTAAEAAILLGAEPQDAGLAPTLVRRLRAISPQMAREIAFRAVGDAAATRGSLPADAPAAVARETRALFEPLLTSAWAPRVYLDRASDDPVAFAPIPLGHLTADHDEEAVDTISEAVERARDATSAANPVSHAQRRARLLAAIAAARDRLNARLASLTQQQRKAADAERLRTRGELIFAYLWQIRPGDTTLEVDSETIPLDPALSAKENAHDYFDRYRKARGAASHVPALRESAEREVAYLDQLQTMIGQAAGFAEIEALTHEWEAHQPVAGGDGATGKAPKKRDAGVQRPRPLLDRDGNAVYVGHSGRQNDLVTFDIAGPEDTWLHARGVPGSHVVVRWRSGRADETAATIEAAAALAAHYSAARGSGSVEVDVTQRKHVRKIKGAGPGMVTYRQEHTIAVHPAGEDALQDVLAAAAG